MSIVLHKIKHVPYDKYDRAEIGDTVRLARSVVSGTDWAKENGLELGSKCVVTYVDSFSIRTSDGHLYMHREQFDLLKPYKEKR